MAFKYNGTSPTTIKYGSTELTVLKYGTTAVWGKPYSLSISAGANTTVTVTRTSSPNQGASTGTLSSGSVIYYGDVITVTYSVSSGYKISTATVNGTTFTSGQSFTVTSAISVVTTAEVSTTWHTVWTGKKTVSWTTSSSMNFTITGSNNNAQLTSITAEVKVGVYWENYDDWTYDDYTVTININGQDINCGAGITKDGTYMIYSGQPSSYYPRDYPLYVSFQSIANNVITCKCSNTYDGGSGSSNDLYYFTTIKSVTLLQVDQYY